MDERRERDLERDRERDRSRRRRPRAVRASTENATRTPKKTRRLRVLSAEDVASLVVAESTRPLTRGECRGGPRPCPFVDCRYHLAVDVSRNGSIKRNFPDLEVDEMEETCALDVADRGAQRLERVGEFLNLTRERVRQIEMRALERLLHGRATEIAGLAEDAGVDPRLTHAIRVAGRVPARRGGRDGRGRGGRGRIRP